MAGQPGFFDTNERLKALSAAGDPLVRLAEAVDFEQFRGELEVALARSERVKGGRPPYDAALMFKVLVLQTLYTLSDDATEYQLKDRLSSMRFCNLALYDPVLDAKTIWLYREQLSRAGKDAQGEYEKVNPAYAKTAYSYLTASQQASRDNQRAQEMYIGRGAYCGLVVDDNGNAVTAMSTIVLRSTRPRQA